MEATDKILEIVKKMEALTEEVRSLVTDSATSKDKIIEKIAAIDKREQE